MSEESFIRALDDHHHFPEMVMIKVIGANRPGFVADALEVIVESLQVRFEPRHSVRETPNKKHVSVSIEVIAGSAVQLATAYERLSKLDGVSMVL